MSGGYHRHRVADDVLHMESRFAWFLDHARYGRTDAFFFFRRAARANQRKLVANFARGSIILKCKLYGQSQCKVIRRENLLTIL